MRLPFLITNPALVAMTTSSRMPCSRTSRPTRRSASPAPYAAAVSINVPPASQNISSSAWASRPGCHGPRSWCRARAATPAARCTRPAEFPWGDPNGLADEASASERTGKERVPANKAIQHRIARRRAEDERADTLFRLRGGRSRRRERDPQ